MGIRATLRRVAPPRSPAALRFLERYEVVSRPFIVASALLPLVIYPTDSRRWGTVLGVLTWLVFVADLTVQCRMRVDYLRSRLGVIDLAIVLITPPWYLIPGAETGWLVILVRFARLARLVVVARGVHRLLGRLGRAGLFAAGAVLVCSYAAWRAERPVNPEFSSFPDAVWWGCVTLTTVGYGDIVPITVPGRVAGVVLMVAGIGLLGVLAGALASFFRLSPQEAAGDEARAAADQDRLGLGRAGPAAPPVASGGNEVAALRRQVSELRAELGRLDERLAGLDPAAARPDPERR